MPGGRPHGSLSKGKSTKGSGPRKTQLIPLSERPGPLLREDVKCCICLSILIEPVTLPCEHALCLLCFKKHVQETSLQCPYCRLRVGTWSRRAFKENNLVNIKLWERIKLEFPRLVQTRQLGEDSQTLDPADFLSVLDQNNVPEHDSEDEDDSEFVLPPPQYCNRGDLKKELDAINRKHEEDLQKQREVEEYESQELIRALREREDAELAASQSAATTKEAADRALAQELVDQELSAERAARNERRQSFSLPPKPSTPPNSGGTIYGIVRTVRSLPNKSNILRKKTSSVVGAPWETPRKRPATPGVGGTTSKRRKDGHSTPFRPASSGGGLNNSQNSILNYLSQPGNSRILFKSPKKSTPATATPMSALYQNQSKPDEFRPSNLVSLSQFSAFSPISPTKSVPIAAVSSTSTASPSVLKPQNLRDADVPSPDSINLEVNSYFRPIRSEPKTPPRRLPDGTLDQESLEVVKTTPVKVAPDLGSPTKIVEVITVNSQDDGTPSQICCVPLACLQDSQSFFEDEEEEIVDGNVTTQTQDSVFEILSQDQDEDDFVPATPDSQSPTTDTNNVDADANNAHATPLSCLEQDSQDSEPELPGTPTPEDPEAAQPSSQGSVESQNMDLAKTAEQAFQLEAYLARARQEEEDRQLAIKLSRELNKPPVVHSSYGLRRSVPAKRGRSKTPAKSRSKPPSTSGSGSRPNTRGSTRSTTASSTVTSLPNSAIKEEPDLD